jgi:outer membrane protein assembly factor BamA
VVFDGRRARLYIDLERRRANRFDGLLGLLPPQSSDQSLQVTAFLDLRIVSAFHTGEEIALKYENLPNTSQSLDAAYRQPFVFGSNFELSARFSLLKQDTSFLRRQFTPTVAYRFSPELSARIFWERRSESLLDPGPYQERVWPPPPVLDSQSNLYGLGLRVDTRDNRRNPSRGWLLDTDFAIGRKTIQPTFGLDSLDYDRLALDQPRREGNLLVQWFIPTWAAQVLVLGNQTYWLDLEEYYDNDLRQLGGARSLRGFNENSFLASFYSIGTLEYRLRIGEASYIGAFGDVSVLEYRSVGTRRLRHPIGIGLTMAFETKAGVVNLSYALGRDEDRPFQPARGRIHLGLMNEF